MSRVCCVTGAAGYIGSWLVRKLLDRGCVVHATLRNLGDESKTSLLRGFPGAAERLVLFEADMYDAASFQKAIAGCGFVFLVASPTTPQYDHSSSKYKDASEAIVDATRTILQQCELSKTVRRVIHTGSVVAAAPLKEDGDGYKDLVDESCWTPLNLSYGYSNEALDAYVSCKILCEQELLKYNESPSRAFDVVIILLGLVGGDTALPYVPGSMQTMLSPLTGDEAFHCSLKFIQAINGAVPLVHVDDACEAHAFFMECSAAAPLAGRFLCAAGHPNMRNVVDHYARRHPELKLRITEVAGEGVRVQGDTRKLLDLGFRYRYGAMEVLDGSVECAKRLGCSELFFFNKFGGEGPHLLIFTKLSLLSYRFHPAFRGQRLHERDLERKLQARAKVIYPLCNSSLVFFVATAPGLKIVHHPSNHISRGVFCIEDECISSFPNMPKNEHQYIHPN